MTEHGIQVGLKRKQGEEGHEKQEKNYRSKELKVQWWLRE